MSVFQEFKEFASKGNVVDLAVGVIIGGAFGKIVTVLVDKVLMPPIGLLIGGVDFSQLRVILKAADAAGKGEVAIGYGELIQAFINFLIIAWALFIVIKGMNALKRSKEATPTPPAKGPSEEVVLLTQIRDSLRSGSL
jgi:large conductance mechanosensitive channel